MLFQAPTLYQRCATLKMRRRILFHFQRRINVISTFSRRLQDFLQKRLQDILKTSSKRFEDVFKTSLRHRQDVLKNVFKTSSRRLQDILKIT